MSDPNAVVVSGEGKPFALVRLSAKRWSITRPVPRAGLDYVGSDLNGPRLAQHYLSDLVIWEPVPGCESLRWQEAMRRYFQLCQEVPGGD